MSFPLTNQSGCFFVTLAGEPKRKPSLIVPANALSSPRTSLNAPEQHAIPADDPKQTFEP